MADSLALGLDLGTTYSCIGVYRNGGVEIIPNRNGDSTTPSIVTIIDNNIILKGEETLNHLVKDYDCSIYAIKRFLGRNFNDQDVQKEIKNENFPFKIIGDKNGNMPLVLIDKNKQEIKFTLQEISSFIIRKMVDSAEAYLGKKVNNLVITVPANFNDAQRNCTKQAAELAGVNVLRIINEPTAAALAYGIGQTNNEEEKKVLVFDLGGGTFDVTILKINKGEEQKFDIMSSKGDKFLGGEDFDNRLVEEILNRFCNKMKESKEEIKKDKKAIKKLKISCENIKRILSESEETTIFINNFYNNNDIFETINRTEFENLCDDLFKRLKIPIEEALISAGLNKNEIEEIVLVGGSSRIPKVKSFLKEYFNISDPNKKPAKSSNSKTILNDHINPDETIAYGATLMAAKILIKNDINLAKFNLMDITPLSLGVAIKNNSKNPEIQKEGYLMSTIIKGGSQIPASNINMYETAHDYQREINVQIFEGDKKYTKYNHILGNLLVSDIPIKKKGEVKVKVKFFVDVNGILSVTATEASTGKSFNIQIKNDNVGLSDEDIKKIKEKNKEYLKISKTLGNKEIDYGKLKKSLKEYQDSYNSEECEEEKYEILKNYIEELEEFIKKFDKNFDNETMVEKYYIYVKDLFNKYVDLLNMKLSTKEDERTIIKNIKEYIQIFVILNCGYLDNLLKIMKNMKKKIFFEIVVIIIEELNRCGIQCIKERKKFCRYNSLIYFEKALTFFKKYIGDLSKLLTISKEIRVKCRDQINLSNSYRSDIHSNALLLSDKSINIDKLKESFMTGFTLPREGLQLAPSDEKEKNLIALDNYEELLIKLGDKVSIEKAICIAIIIKIAVKLMGDTNYKKYMKLGENCEFIIRQLDINTNEEWVIEFQNLYEEIKDNYNTLEENEKEMRENIKKKYKDKFDEIDTKFAKRHNNIEFIKYILELLPYKGYEEDKANKKIDFNTESQELISHLQVKYHPNNYDYTDDEESKLNYVLIEYIESYINKMLNNLY